MTLKCLPLRVEHRPHEPAYSLLNRMTLRHGTADVGGFVETIPGAPVAFAARVRRGDALAELATLSGAREENLYASTARVSGRSGRVRLGGIAVAERSELRFGGICPACLREDLDKMRGAEAVRPYRRTWWDLRIVKACPTHSRLLLMACPGCGAVRDRRQASPRWCHCGCDLSLAATAEVPQPDVEADRFIVGRITSPDAVPHPVLGGLALNDAMTLLLRVGRCARRGSQDAEIDLRKAAATPEQRCRIASAGWRALEDWPRNFFPVLDALVAGTSPGSSHRIAGRYGPLHLWLSKTEKPEYGPLRAAITDHARSVHPATARNRLFGGRDRASHDASHKMTARAAVALSGLSQQTLRRLLLHLGRTITEETGRNWVAERSDIELARDWARNHLTTVQTQRQLGIGRTLFDKLAWRGPFRVALRSCKTLPTYYVRSDVEALVAQARQGSPDVDGVPAGARTLREMCEAGTPFLAALAMLVDRRLTCVGLLKGTKGLYGLCIGQGAQPTPSTRRPRGNGGRGRHAWARRTLDGDTSPHRIEAYHGAIMATIEAEEGSTPAAMAAMLQREHGASFSQSTIRRFLDRRGGRGKRG